MDLKDIFDISTRKTSFFVLLIPTSLAMLPSILYFYRFSLNCNQMFFKSPIKLGHFRLLPWQYFIMYVRLHGFHEPIDSSSATNDTDILRKHSDHMNEKKLQYLLCYNQAK